MVVANARSGEIMFSNMYADRVVGRPLAEIAGQFPMFHLDGRPYSFEERQVPRSLGSGEEIVDEEFFGPAPDGGRVRYRCSSWPVYDDGGQIVAAVVVTRDVTEQKRQEERLTYLASLLDHTDDAIVALDAQWYVRVWNKGAERLYGWTADEVVGRHTLEVARLDMSYEDRGEVRRATAERGRWRGEVVAYRKDDTPICVELITVALRGDGGEITGYLGIHRDVTDRKRAEDELREAKRRSEEILQSISDDFLAVDREWRYTYVNQRGLAQARRVMGRDITAAELLGMSLWEVVPQLVGGKIYNELHRAMREQKASEFEAYSEATGRWLEVRAFPTKDGLTVYTHDISERKAAEEAMKRQVREQALVADLGLRALATDAVEELMHEAAELVARTLEVKFAGVAERAPRGDAITVRAGVGWAEGVVGRRLEREGGRSLLGYTLRRRAPVIVEDIDRDPRFEPSAVANAHGIVSALSVVIETSGEPFGLLAVASARRRRFSRSDVSFVQAVANVLAGAVQRSREERRVAEVRDAERRRIARALHDEALQELAEAVVKVGRGRSDGLGPEAARELVSTLERVNGQLRGAIYDLRLGEDEGRAFPERLRALVEVHRALAVDHDIRLEIAGDTAAGPLGHRATEVLRIVGEALSNARRHSGARHIRVSAGGPEDKLRVEVADDGRGFDAAAEPSGSERMGITGMRERAALLDGALDIRSTPGAGTTVRLQLG